MTASVATQGLLLSACDTQTLREIEGVQVTPAIPGTQISSTEKSEGKTKNLIFENFQVSNKLLFVACFSGGIFMSGVFSWQPRRRLYYLQVSRALIRFSDFHHAPCL